MSEEQEEQGEQGEKESSIGVPSGKGTVMNFPRLKTELPNEAGINCDDLPIRITGQIGQMELNVKTLKSLGEGSILEFTSLAGDPILLLANGEPFALGEVVVIDDFFGVRITDILSPEAKLSFLKRGDSVPFGRVIKEILP